tara:strand:+ start:753 stop:1652 length:900 start_codon:yes stop_codon:yes gene_type:complete
MNQIICLLIRFTGIFYLLKRTILKRKVSIVLYHDPKPDVFEKHIKFLNCHYTFISMDVLVNAIINKDWSDIPNNSMVVTFDDGHIGNYELLKTIKKYKIKPTIYCCSDIIGTYRHFWWKECNISNIERLKIFSNKERLILLRDKYNFWNDKVYSDKQALDYEQIIELSKFSTIGSHTQFHSVLTCCESNEIEDEIYFSKNKIEELTATECQHFCYPNGDYNQEVINKLKIAGYKSARTIDVGWNDINTDPFRLKITGITDNASLTHVIAQLTGITMFLRYLSEGSFRGLYKTTSVKEKL